MLIYLLFTRTDGGDQFSHLSVVTAHFTDKHKFRSTLKRSLNSSLLLICLAVTPIHLTLLCHVNRNKNGGNEALSKLAEWVGRGWTKGLDVSVSLACVAGS